MGPLKKMENEKCEETFVHFSFSILHLLVAYSRPAMTSASRFAELSTPLLSDAVMRLGLTLRLAPSGLSPVHPGLTAVSGPVAPARHRGSVDVFLEAIDRASPGDVLVIDNDGRRDEGCIGDLSVLEARAAGLAGVVVWGCHRDTTELRNIDMPVFSYGSFPGGPRRLDSPEPDTRFGDVPFSADDFVFVDQDGALFVEKSQLNAVLEAAETIAGVERGQASRVRGGESLRSQLRFSQYLEKRKSDPSYTLRKHLAETGGAIEV
jgi:4-hydroxy-4-methyl-2-oxoglutarate aldolase